MLKAQRFRPPETTGWVVWICSELAAKGDLTSVRNTEIDGEVLSAVQKETDRTWQLKLLGAVGEYRDAVLEEWRTEREPDLE